MGRKRKKIFFVFWGILILLVLIGNGKALGEYVISENSSLFHQSYKEDEFFRGKINASFDNYENAEFSDNFGNSIKLLDLLKNMSLNKGSDYRCEPLSCEEGYEISSSLNSQGAESKTFTLNNMNRKKAYGLRVAAGGGAVSSISELKINLSSGTNLISNKQLYVDILGDGINEFKKTNAADEVYGNRNKGCFDDIQSTSNIIIPQEGGTEGYICEKMNFTAAPGYQIGAKVQKREGADGIIYLRLTKLDGSLVNSNPQSTCAKVPDANREINCDINHSSEINFTALVCVTSNESYKYEIRSEEEGENCGGFGNPANRRLNYSTDYEIYWQARKYAAVGNVQVSANNNLKTAILNYLQNAYGSRCPNGGCIIPIIVKSEDEQTQEITLSSAFVAYSKSGGLASPETLIYELETKLIRISANYTLLDIEKMGFKVPNINGRHLWEPKFNEEDILERINKTFNVDIGFSFDIGPKTVLIGRKTYFTAIGFGNRSINSSSWNFGDGSATEEFQGYSAEHTYSNTSAAGYRITVTLREANGGSSTKKFAVVAGDIKESINKTITDYQTRLSNVGREITRFPTNVGNEVKNRIGLDGLNSNLTLIKNRYNNPSIGAGDEYYMRIVSDLLALDVPYSAVINENGSLPASVGYANINPGHIISISNAETGNYDLESLRRAINNWMGLNYNVEVSYNNIAVLREEGTQSLMKTYKIRLTKKAESTSSESSYIVINYPADSSFKALNPATMNKVTSNGASYAAISSEGNPNIIEFLIAGSNAPSVEDLGIYISPTLEELKVLPSNILPAEPGGFRWSVFLIWTGILLFLAFVVYIILTYWYKFKYERSLFKNPQDLYNIINFIYNARKSGLGDLEIKTKLQEKKWKGEQITYAFNKIDGKRTGMWEIPIFRFLENKKVKEEIEKKQGKPLDARFIKRQN